MKKSIRSIFWFGFLLAALALLLEYFQYKYFIGSLNTNIYTSVVATLFTVIGIWIGIRIFKSKEPEVYESSEINHSKLKEFELNEREYEILQLISKGHSNQAIADQLFLALPTVKTHTSNLYVKLDVKSRTQAIHKARSLHLI